MHAPPTRRKMLQTLGALSLVTAGCLTTGSPESSTTDDQSPTSERETTSPTIECKLNHEVWEKGKYGGYHGEEVQLSELTEQGQEIFVKALDSGGYSFAYNGTNSPPDFVYSDETTTYEVIYEDNQYVLLTYTSTGCIVK